MFRSRYGQFRYRAVRDRRFRSFRSRFWRFRRVGRGGGAGEAGLRDYEVFQRFRIVRQGTHGLERWQPYGEGVSDHGRWVACVSENFLDRLQWSDGIFPPSGLAYTVDDGVRTVYRAPEELPVVAAPFGLWYIWLGDVTSPHTGPQYPAEGGGPAAAFVTGEGTLGGTRVPRTVRSGTYMLNTLIGGREVTLYVPRYVVSLEEAAAMAPGGGPRG